MENTTEHVAGCDQVTTILYGRHVELVPFKDAADLEYLVDLIEIDEHPPFPRNKIAEVVQQYGLHFWVIEVRGVRSGIGLCLKVNDKILLEALKDKRVPGNTIKHSIESGQLMLDFMFGFTDTVHTCAREEDKGIQILCKKLGFRQTGIVESPYGGKIMLFQKEDKKCQSLQQ